MASFWTVTPPYRNTAVGQTVGSLDSAFALQGTFIASSPISCVIRAVIDGQAYFVKTYTRGGKNLKRWFGRSRARAEWENLLYFERLGLPTAPLVAYGQEMLGGIFRRGALVTQEVTGALDLERLCARRHPLLARRAWFSNVSRQLAEHTRRLHRDGFGHLDLKLRNILVTLEATPQIYFIDCPAGRHRRGPMARRWFVKDLAGLDRDAQQWVPPTRRLRFFLDYLGRPSLESPDKKAIARIQRFYGQRPPKKVANSGPTDTAWQMPYYDAKTLRRAGHNLQTPFRIHGRHDGKVSPLVCQDILRHLPGKRLVCRVRHNQRSTAIAKIYLRRRHAPRHLKRELRGLAALRAARITSPTLLYHGSIDHGGNLLLLEEIENACRLDRYLADLPSDQARQQALAHVMTCIAGLHAAGLSQRDIHPGNFLVADRDIWVIDGSAIQVRYPRRPLAVKPSLSNLALFWAQFDSAYTRWAALLLAHYGHARNWASAPDLEEQLTAAITRQRIRRLANRSRKMMRTSTAAMARKSWRRYIICDRQWYRPDGERLLTHPDDFMRRGQIIKAGNTATVARARFQGQDLVIKRYNLKNSLHCMRRGLRPSRALLSWRNAHVLLQLRIQTPRPLAMIEERWGPLRLRAYYISAYQPGPILAAYWPRDQTTENPSLAPLSALADLFQKMADAQICHGDCKASNMVVDGDAIALLDLDGLRIVRSRRAFRRRFSRDCQRFKRNWPRDSLIHRKVEEFLSKLRMPATVRSGDRAGDN